MPAGLERHLEHVFADPRLLEQALTHPSAVAQTRSPGQPAAYERLEFLGDRVLGLVVADMLLKAFPSEAEGALARRHAALVRRESVVRVAEDIGLAQYLRLSKGEADSGGRTNPGLLADAGEAVIGAMFLDGGFEVAARFVRARWQPLMAESARPPKDAKTTLQEWAQGSNRGLPVYRVVATEGPPHDPTFTVAVLVDGLPPVTAHGTSKRAAEQAAAAGALEIIPK